MPDKKKKIPAEKGRQSTGPQANQSAQPRAGGPRTGDVKPVSLPGFDDLRVAATAIRNHTVRTPLVWSPFLSGTAGLKVSLKLESLQRTGSFKFRGALNRLLAIPLRERSRGAVAWSSGNHGHAVAAAARLLRMPATIVMPADAPAIKREGVRATGADIRLYDRESEDREALAREIARQTGACLVPPYDDRHVIAGQGTVGLEIVSQCEGELPDAVLVPCSGGGLSAGIALAMERLSPASRVYAVEPEGFDDTRRSLLAGHRLGNAARSGSICDSLLAEQPGEMTFALNSARLEGCLAVGDALVRQAMRLAARELKLVLEPGGAIGLAALLAGHLPLRSGHVVIVLSGGNVDPEMFSSLTERRERAGRSRQPDIGKS